MQSGYQVDCMMYARSPVILLSCLSINDYILVEILIMKYIDRHTCNIV